MKNIQIQNNTDSNLSKRYILKFKTLVLRILKTQKPSNSRNRALNIKMSVTFIDNKYIKKLNLKYRKKNYSTDVIAFRLDAGTSNNIVLGDIYISVERAVNQVLPEETIEIELARLIIHGVLHVLGYNHGYKMQKQEKYYLNFFNSRK